MNVQSAPATAGSLCPAVSWLRLTDRGLWCEPGRFFIDPITAVDRAVVTHAHTDHARPGHGSVLATPATLALMRARYGIDAYAAGVALDYGALQHIDGVVLRLQPAGHVLGSAQVELVYAGTRVVVSGDYKRRLDPTCEPFAVTPCDVFITEATFGLPVFRHPPDGAEVEKLLTSLKLFPDRTHLIGVYALGKCQRLIRLLREAGYERPIWLHGALKPLCEAYERLGIALGDLRVANGKERRRLSGELVLCPPSALADRWNRAFPDPVIGLASGWMLIRQRARQRGVELPLVLSDHADWDELTQTMTEVLAAQILVTHGREQALVRHARALGLSARSLSIVGYEDEGG
ncbi:MAG: ligase-associated DNA damage response exonuclease [Defluviicoccus sp.]